MINADSRAEPRVASLHAHGRLPLYIPAVPGLLSAVAIMLLQCPLRFKVGLSFTLDSLLLHISNDALMHGLPIWEVSK